MATPKILFTNNSFHFLAGSEMFVYSLAKVYRERGWEVAGYSTSLGPMAARMKNIGCLITNNLDDLPWTPTVIHAHHNGPALAARKKFPDVPMVYVCHGVIKEVSGPETPNIEKLGAQRYGAVSEEVREHLTDLGVPETQQFIIRQPILLDKFQETAPLSHGSPRRALYLSHYPGFHKYKSPAVIEHACDKLRMSVKRVGFPTAIWEVEKEINNVDVVITLGRGALEATACGRVVVVYDRNFGDGLLTPQSYYEFRRCNLSGRAMKIDFNHEQLAEVIKNGFHPRLPETNRREFMGEHDANLIAGQAIQQYRLAGAGIG